MTAFGVSGVPEQFVFLFETAAKGDALFAAVKNFSQETGDFHIVEIAGTSEKCLQIQSSGIRFQLYQSEYSLPRSDLHYFGTDRLDEHFKSSLGLRLDETSIAGQQSPSIWGELLNLGAKIARIVAAETVLWTDTKLLSNASSFVAAVQAFDGGGGFPALNLIKFGRMAGGAIKSNGLAWFCNTEILVICDHLSEEQAMRRVIRLCHDFAINGTVLEASTVDGIEANELWHFDAQKGSNAVLVTITSKTE